MFDTKKFGGYLSRLRKNADMTQIELADRLNLTRQAISRYEHGDSFPDVSILVLIADIFNITLDELIGSGEPTRGESRILEGIASGDEYVTAENIEDIDAVIKELTKEMQLAAKNLMFERAAALRDKIAELKEQNN